MLGVIEKFIKNKLTKKRHCTIIKRNYTKNIVKIVKNVEQEKYLNLCYLQRVDNGENP